MIQDCKANWPEFVQEVIRTGTLSDATMDRVLGQSDDNLNNVALRSQGGDYHPQRDHQSNNGAHPEADSWSRRTPDNLNNFLIVLIIQVVHVKIRKVVHSISSRTVIYPYVRPCFYIFFSSGGKTNKVTHFVEHVLPARKIRDAGSISIGYDRTSNYEVKVFHPSSSDRRLN